MSVLFDRAASVTFGKRGEVGTLVSGLRISFNIEKTSESNANTAKIAIYNLNPTHRQQLEESGNVVILKAGYKGFSDEPIDGILFQGDVSKSTTVKKGADYVTTIDGGDGEKALLDEHFEKSYGAGALLSTVIDDISKTFSLAVGAIKDIGGGQLINGGAISGKIKDILDGITERLGLEWSVQNEALLIEKPTNKNEALAILLNSKTGLISTPIKKDDGIETEAFLNPSIVPGSTVIIESEHLQDKRGTFRVRRCIYEGDTHGGKWQVKFEAK